MPIGSSIGPLAGLPPLPPRAKGGPHVTTPLATHASPAFLGLGSAPGARMRAGQDSLGARPVATLPRQPVQHDDISPPPPGPSRRPALCVPGHGLRQRSKEAVAHGVPSFGSLRRPRPPGRAPRPSPPRPLSGAYPHAGVEPPGRPPAGEPKEGASSQAPNMCLARRPPPGSPTLPQSPRNQQSPRIPLLGPPVRRAQVGNLGEEGLTLSRS